MRQSIIVEIREWIIDAWHSLLDYDTRMPPKKHELIQAERDQNRALRLKNDEMRALRAKDRRKEKDQKKEEWAQYLLEQNGLAREEREAQNMKWELQSPDRSQRGGFRRCRYCGGELVPKARSTDSGVGCLILIVGLVLTPFLIGIPIIIAGIYFMLKSEKYVKCRKCGCAG